MKYDGQDKESMGGQLFGVNTVIYYCNREPIRGVVRLPNYPRFSDYRKYRVFVFIVFFTGFNVYI